MTRFYRVLSVVAVIIMIVAAYITYGNQAREFHVEFEKEVSSANQNEPSENSIRIGADLSRVPSDDVVEDILNDVIPNVCDDCDEDNPLDCLKEYETNTILVQNPPHQNHLFIELITGKTHKEKFVVVIDLNNGNQVLNAEGKIDEDRCRDVSKGEVTEGSILTDGMDPKSSNYVDTKPLD